MIQTFGNLDYVGGGKGPVFCCRCAEEGYGLAMYVIYDRPRDYPDKIVIRKWIAAPGMEIPTRFITLHDTLEEAREALAPLRLYRDERNPAADPVVLEVWF